MLEDSRLDRAVEWASTHGVTYADARYVERESETLSPAGEFKPTDFYEPRFLRELEQEGFIKELYR